MGRIYDATWGRAFSALYDRALKATEEAGLRRDAHASCWPRRGGGWSSSAPAPASTSISTRTRSRSWSWSSPTRTWPSGCATRLARLRARRPTLVEAPAERAAVRGRQLRHRRRRPWSSARSPTRPRRSPRSARVLKPGGRLLFIEHVRAEDPGLARWQDRLEKPWRFLADGCHCNRDTAGDDRRLGLQVEDVDRRPACRRRCRWSTRWSAAAPCSPASFSVPGHVPDVEVVDPRPRRLPRSWRR